MNQTPTQDKSNPYESFIYATKSHSYKKGGFDESNPYAR